MNFEKNLYLQVSYLKSEQETELKKIKLHVTFYSTEVTPTKD